MWKKNDVRPDEPTPPQSQPQSQPRPAAKVQQSEAPPAATQSARARTTSSVAGIGPSITIKGDVIGEEDLVIEGRVDGEIKVNRHAVTVGRSGKIKADIHAKAIQIEGEVLGNLWGDEAVVIRTSGTVQGNVTAPRVTLEDGSTFRGSIDMQPPKKEAGTAEAAQKGGESAKATGPTRSTKDEQRREKTA